MHTAVLWAAAGTGFTFLMTTLGAGLVFFFRKQFSAGLQRVFLGFAAGVMIAAAVWSLLIPAIDQAEAAGAFGLGAGRRRVFARRRVFNRNGFAAAASAHRRKAAGGPVRPLKRTTLLFTAVTLHNIPEGMAVGLSFALAAQGGQAAGYTAAMALALGIGIQNFPEGAAISLPLRQEGKSVGRAFWMGSLSGVVEPIFGVLTVLIAGSIQPLMPWLLSFAAGAMIYVVVEELIPEAHLGEHSHVGTLGVIFGFVVMMILDVALG